MTSHMTSHSYSDSQKLASQAHEAHDGCTIRSQAQTRYMVPSAFKTPGRWAPLGLVAGIGFQRPDQLADAAVYLLVAFTLLKALTPDFLELGPFAGVNNDCGVIDEVLTNGQRPLSGSLN